MMIIIRSLKMCLMSYTVILFKIKNITYPLHGYNRATFTEFLIIEI